MKILVTGGAGFIGSHVSKALLQQGHEVVVVDDLSSGKRSNVPAGAQFVEGDIRVIANLPVPEKIDAVFHLAAQIDVRVGVSNPMLDASVNVKGTVAVLDYAVKAGAKKFVFTSSGGAIYGPSDVIPTPETADCQSSSPYGVAKWCGEQYVHLFGRMYALPHVILRYSNVYGPGQEGSRESGVIAIFTRLAASGQPLTIFGDGSKTRDFVYVDDVVAANLKALTYGENGVFNIGTGKETSIKAMAETLNGLLPSPVAIHHAPDKVGEELRSVLDVSLAAEKLEWQPQVNLTEGLRRTLAAAK